MQLIPHPCNPQAPKMKNAKLGFARYHTPMLAVMITLGTLMLAQLSHAAACVNGVYRAGCVDPNGVWEFARHIRTITVMGTTVRLVVPTAPTERGASDPMGLRSSAGHISGKTPRAAASKEPQLVDRAVVAVRMSGSVGAAISQSTIQQPLDIGTVA
jgi:hypothetical protein